MRLDKYISRSRVIDLGSADMEGALVELLNLTVESFPDLNKDALLKGLLRRENTMTTYLGLGVAMPHVRVKMGRRYILAVGRSHYGIRYDGALENEPVRLVLMLIADEKTRDYLQLLAALARLMKEQDFVDSLVQAPDLDTLYDRLFAGFGGMAAKPVAMPQTRVNRVVLREAERIAVGSGCTGLMVFGDTFAGNFKAPKWAGSLKTILVTRNLAEAEDRPDRFDDSIHVRSFSSQRMAQLRSAVLVGITRGLITFKDRICCVGGLAGSNQFDTIVIVDVEKEFSTLLTGHADLLPPDVKPEVLERVIAVATELAVEGREGRPGRLPLCGGRQREARDADQAARAQSVLRLQGGGPEHPESLHGRDHQGVLLHRRGIRHPRRRGGGGGRLADPGFGLQPCPAQRTGRAARRRRRHLGRGRLHRARRLLQLGAGDSLPARRHDAPDGKEGIGVAEEKVKVKGCVPLMICRNHL
jgi:diadenylate cyclase